MSRLAYVICRFLIVLPAVTGCGGSNGRLAIQIAMIIGRWETTENDPARDKTIWEFTKDGKVRSSSGPEVALNGTFKFLDNDTMEIAWKGMEKVTFKIKLTEDELESRVVSINLGDGELTPEGPITTTTMKRAKP